MCQVSTGSGEEDFQVEDVYIHVVKSHFWKGSSLSFNKLEISSSNYEYFVESHLEIVIWTKRFLKDVNVFSLFGYHHPSKKSMALWTFEEIKLESHLRWVWLMIGPVVLERTLIWKESTYLAFNITTDSIFEQNWIPFT